MKHDTNAFDPLAEAPRTVHRNDPPEEPRTLSWLTPWWLAAGAVLLTVLLAG